MSLLIEECSVHLGGTKAVDGASAHVRQGEWLGVIGPNGAGKSSLCRAVLSLVTFSGHITVMGHDAASQSKRQWARLVAYVPQRPVLPPSMTVTDYVLLGRCSHQPLLGGESRQDRAAVASMLERLELGPFAHRPLAHLSGGEAQRAVLARAMAQEAPVLVMDEPTTSLDLGHSQMVLALADELRREKGLVVLCTLHDLTLAGQYSDRLMVMSRGRAVMDGPVADVLTAPNIERYFEADVEVVPGPWGPAVVPVRRRPSPNAFTETMGTRSI